MRLKKLLVGITAAVSLTATVPLATFTTSQITEAASLNDLAKQNSYVGTTFLYKWLQTQGIRYNKFYSKNKIVYRNNGKPEGVVIHETADPGATAKDEAIYFNREWNKMYAYVHAFVDHNQVIQMMTPDYGAWGAGPMANDRFVQVELCQENNRTDFAKSINNDAIYVAKILHRYDLQPTNATHNGKGTVWSHLAVSKFLGGTDHGDPDGYFAKWGYNMDSFFELVKYYYNLQEGNTSEANKVTSPEANITQAPTVKPGQRTLMHDAYSYDENGKRIKGKKIRKAGTAVDVKQGKTIGKKKFYQIADNEYIAAGNLDGTMRTLKHNSYIYDTVGVKTGTSKLLKGNQVKTYGSKVKIEGTQYYAIGATQFVKANNF